MPLKRVPGSGANPRKPKPGTMLKNEKRGTSGYWGAEGPKNSSPRKPTKKK